jgi:lysine 2-monooxygenase
MIAERHPAAMEEFARRNRISKLEFLFDVENINPATLPDSPFDWPAVLERPAEYFDGIPFGEEVAVIGGGNAGCAAAYLLARLGLKPVLYEITKRIGGRSYTHPLGPDGQARVELGSMRIPLIQELVFYFLDRWGIKYKPFQNPLYANTVIDVNNQQVFYSAVANGFTSGPPHLIAQILTVQEKYGAIINPITDAWNAASGDLPKQWELWQKFVDDYNNKSLYQILIEQKWTTSEINLFGYIGIGSGGFDAFFGSSFLEIVRIEIQQLETKGSQQLIIGGTNQIPSHLWSEEMECLHWGRTSVQKLNGGTPSPGIRSIRTAPHGQSGPVTIVDTEGNEKQYEAVILSASPRAIDMTLNINFDAFSVDVWTALRDVELTSSEKVFVLTETAFWNDPNTEFPFYTTLTDQPPRQMYTFDKSDWGTETPHGAICMSYAWGSSAIRYNALDAKEKVTVCLNAIEHMDIYGRKMREKLEKEIIDTVSICWEDVYGYSGGYRMANPGQAQQVANLQAQSLGLHPEWNNGLYLAGEAMSWYGLSGWIDGAIKTGFGAAVSAVRRLL